MLAKLIFKSFVLKLLADGVEPSVCLGIRVFSSIIFHSGV